MFSDGINHLKVLGLDMQKINIVLLLLLVSCASKIQSKKPHLSLYTLENMEGLSGLSFQGMNREGDLIFWSHTDRGPNAMEFMDPELGQKRPFINPGFRPYWINFSVNPITKKVKILNTVELSISGLPNTKVDEIPVDQRGKILKRDLMGADPEAICFDGTHVWMGEEYRPSILKFDLEGKLLRRYVPEDSFTSEEMKQTALKGIVLQNLPKNFKDRKLNRGFEGLACDQGKVFAILQSPLPKAKHEVLMLEFNSASEKTERIFTYPLEASADKIGDLVMRNNKFYVIEQNGGTGPESFHKVFQFDLEKSQGLRVKKDLAVDLVKVGYDFADKIEGLSVLNDGSIVIVNDNDFGVDGDKINPLRKTIMGIIDL